MQCPSCGTEALPGKSFCHACGAKLETKCASCGAKVGPAFRFCPDCGANLAESPPPAPSVQPPVADDRLGRLTRHIPEDLSRKILAAKGSITGERKLVTVLFCDLVGSTALAENLDPEEYRELLEQYLELAFREIYRFEGIVNQLAGDGLMALFGAPVAHEDAPQRALRAALAVRDSLKAFNEEARRARRPELRARIGIHTGPVVVGTVGNDLKMDYTAIGDTTNLAARLQSLAEPGSVLVSEATHRLVRGFFRVKSIGPLEIRGKSDPVTAYQVLGTSEHLTPMAVAEARGLTRFVGRTSELAQLRASFDQLAANLPQVISVVGEAGSGKSRLLYEFRQQLGATPATFFEARCSSMTQGIPYAPWVGMLRQFFALRSGEASECCCDKVQQKIRELDLPEANIYPYLCRLLALPIDGLPDQPAEEIREQTFEAMAKLVIGASQHAPVVLSIEDLHWIDDASREMLELAVARLHQVPVMIALSHRPEYQPAWQSRVAFTQLRLRRLTEPELREIVRSLAGGPLPPELESIILVKAEGNPFFAEEITRALVDEGYLIRGERHVRLTRPVEQIRIPDTVQELIAARLDRLEPASKRVLQVASVFGRQFRRDHLGRLLDIEGVDATAELRSLEAAGFLHRKNVLSDDELRFGESLVQEVAYEGLLLRERRQLHERIALLLEGEPGDRSADQSAILAHHFARGDNRRKAIESLVVAARAAEKLPSYNSAARFYQQAWEIAESGLATDDGSAIDFRRAVLDAAVGLCRMAVIYGSSDIVATERVAPRALEIAKEIGDYEKVGGLSVFHGLALASGARERFGDGVKLVEKGFAIAEKADSGGLTLSIGRGLAWTYILDGEFDKARARLQPMLDQLERSGDRERLSDVYFGVVFVRNGLSYYTDAFEGARDGARVTYELAVRASNRTVQSGSASWLSWILFDRAEYEEALTWADRSLEIAERIGNLSAVRTAASLALACRAELGHDTDIAHFLRLIEHDFAGRGDMALKAHLSVQAILAVGETDRARKFAEHALPFAGGRLREMVCSVAVGDATQRLGPDLHPTAAVHYRRALDLATTIGVRSAWAHATLGIAEIEAAQGDREDASQKATAALEVYRSLGLLRYSLRAEQLLAKLAAAA